MSPAQTRSNQVIETGVFVLCSEIGCCRHCGDTTNSSLEVTPMSAQFPDVETVRSALALAGRAPSVHNSQPWRWRVGEQSLHLYADPDLHLTHIDPDGRD